MIKIIFLLLSYAILYATPTLNINTQDIAIEDFDLEYYVAESSEVKLEEIKNKTFIQSNNKFSLGSDSVNTWIRFKIHNSSKELKQLFLHNKLAFLSLDTSFYELKNDHIQNSISINLLNHKDGSFKQMHGTDAIFPINLEVNETKTIYIYNNMTVTQFVNLLIYDKNSSKDSLINNNALILIMLGMLISLVFYHLIIYTSTRYQEYLYYSLYLIMATLWQAQLSGILSNSFDFYFTPGNKYYLTCVILLPIFLTLFSKTIFHTQLMYKLEDKLLNSVIILFSIIMLIALIIDIDFALDLTKLSYVYLFIIIFYTSYKIMKKGNPVAKIFLWGNSSFAFFTLITDLYYSGLIPYSYFVFNAAHIGILIEAFILSYIITYRIKLLKEKEIQNLQELANQTEIKKRNELLQLKVDEAVEKSREKDKVMFQQSKMISMGEMIENIAHQWRQPLSEVNASVFVIDNIIYERYKSDPEIEKELTSIENLTNHMSKTIDSFQNYFDNSKEKREFSLRSSIYDSILILGKSLDNNNVMINIDIEKGFIHNGFKNEFQQVILVILNNAKEALLAHKIQNPKIDIKIQKLHDKYKISICDNAGGIKNAVIDKIFDPYFTTKHKTQGRGLGLYISKLIIEDKMNGSISVKNIADGVCFNIILKREKLSYE